MTLRLPLVFGMALAAAMVAAAGASAQGPDIPLTTWSAVKNPRFTLRDGLLRIAASGGRLESKSNYVDFVLRLDFRSAEPGSAGAVLLRGWDGYEGALGYRVVLEDPVPGATEVGTVGVRRRKTPAAGPDAGALALATMEARPAGWHRFELRCEGDRVSAALDGAALNTVEGSEPLAGYVGFEVSRGAFEFRDVSVTQLSGGVFLCPDRPPAPDVPLATAPGIVLPRLLHEEKPRYAVDAMQRQMQGMVSLAAVVGTDGRVESVCVDRSLDPALDAQAVGAARRWRFEPGRKNGEPIRTRVTIDLTFRLK